MEVPISVVPVSAAAVVDKVTHQQLKSKTAPSLISKIKSYVCLVFSVISKMFLSLYHHVYSFCAFLKKKFVNLKSGDQVDKLAQSSDVFKKIETIQTTDYSKVEFEDNKLSSPNIQGTKWLSNLHINSFIMDMMDEYPKLFRHSQYFVPHFYDVENKQFFFDTVIKRFDESYSKQNSNDPHESIFAYPLFVSGSNVGTSYCLVIVDHGKKTVEYYDSKKNYGDHENIVSCLTELTNTLSEHDKVLNKNYTFVKKITTSLQPDTYQSGVWVCYFLEQRLKNPDFNFNQLDVEKAQKQIAKFRSYVMDKLVASDKKNKEKMQVKG